MTRRERLQFLFLWLGLGVLPLFLRPLWEPDEGRYAEIPREMLATGDWLTPSLNFVAYFEKPPLQYWLSAMGMRLFGTSPWAARLPLAAATALAMWAAWRLARRLGAVTPIWASFMAATSLLAFVCGQTLTLDALFTACLLVTLTAAIEAVDARMARRGAVVWTSIAFISLALAFLTKGLAAIVLVGGVLVFAAPFAWRHVPLRKALLRTIGDPIGWILFLAVAAPWFILVERANPGHARFFFIHEHFARFTSTVHARQGHPNPLLDKLYFVPVLALGLLPWISSSLVGLWRGATFLRSRGPQSEQGPLLRWAVAMLVMGFAWPFLFFSLSGSKLPTYILPAIVPLVVLAAAFEETHEAWRTLARSGWELLALGLLVAVGLPLAMKDGGTSITQTDPGSLGWMLAMGFAFMGLGLWARSPRGLTGNRWMAVHSAALILFIVGAQRLEGSRKSVGHLVSRAPANAQWISHGNYFQGIAFQAGQRTTVINGTGELAFGAQRLNAEERGRWFQEDPLTLNPMADRMRREDPTRPVWAVIDRDSWKLLPEDVKAAWEPVARTPSSWLMRYR